MSSRNPEQKTEVKGKIGSRVHYREIPGQEASFARDEERFFKDTAVVKAILDKFKAETDHQKAETDALIEMGKLREPFAWAFTWLVIGWLSSVMILVICVGTKSLQLSDTILGMLIGSVAIDLIGLLVIIARFLFPDPRIK